MSGRLGSGAKSGHLGTGAGGQRHSHTAPSLLSMSVTPALIQDLSTWEAFCGPTVCSAGPGWVPRGLGELPLRLPKPVCLPPPLLGTTSAPRAGRPSFPSCACTPTGPPLEPAPGPLQAWTPWGPRPDPGAGLTPPQLLCAGGSGEAPPPSGAQGLPVRPSPGPPARLPHFSCGLAGTGLWSEASPGTQGFLQAPTGSPAPGCPRGSTSVLLVSRCRPTCPRVYKEAMSMTQQRPTLGARQACHSRVRTLTQKKRTFRLWGTPVIAGNTVSLRVGLFPQQSPIKDWSPFQSLPVVKATWCFIG